MFSKSLDEGDAEAVSRSESLPSAEISSSESYLIFDLMLQVLCYYSDRVHIRWTGLEVESYCKLVKILVSQGMFEYYSAYPAYDQTILLKILLCGMEITGSGDHNLAFLDQGISFIDSTLAISDALKCNFNLQTRYQWLKVNLRMKRKQDNRQILGDLMKITIAEPIYLANW